MGWDVILADQRKFLISLQYFINLIDNRSIMISLDLSMVKGTVCMDQ